MTGQPGNGHFDPDGRRGARRRRAARRGRGGRGAAEALAEADETLDERVEAVVEELDDVERRRDGESVTYLARGAAFAVLAPDALEVALDAAVAKAALKTPDASVSRRGRRLDRVHAEVVDRFALDRAEAWLRSAHRRAAGG